MQVRAVMKKPWWNYALLVAGIFIFTQGCYQLNRNIELAFSLIFFGMIMHGYSMKNLCGKLLTRMNRSGMEKDRFEIIISKSAASANIIMQIMLLVISIFCYFYHLSIAYILLLDVAAVAVYIIASSIKYSLESK